MPSSAEGSHRSIWVNRNDSSKKSDPQGSRMHWLTVIRSQYSCKMPPITACTCHPNAGEGEGLGGGSCWAAMLAEKNEPEIHWDYPLSPKHKGWECSDISRWPPHAPMWVSLGYVHMPKLYTKIPQRCDYYWKMLKYLVLHLIRSVVYTWPS